MDMVGRRRIARAATPEETMNLDTLLQTRIPNAIYSKVEKAAKADGLSIAAWLRRLIMQEILRIEARRPCSIPPPPIPKLVEGIRELDEPMTPDEFNNRMTGMVHIFYGLMKAAGVDLSKLPEDPFPAEIETKEIRNETKEMRNDEHNT